MKLFTALLGTETNTFSPFATGYQNFSDTYLTRNGEHGDQASAFAVPLIIWRDRARERGWSVVESLAAFATPAGHIFSRRKRSDLPGYVARSSPVIVLRENVCPC